MSKWIEFEETPYPGRKTKVWDIRAKASGEFIGEIAWHSPWRQYCFYPAISTLWNTECLKDVIDFIAEHKGDRQ